VTKPADVEGVAGFFSKPHSLDIGLGPITNLVETHSGCNRHASVMSVMYLRLRPSPVGMHVCVR